jgi:hypothetical protein
MANKLWVSLKNLILICAFFKKQRYQMVVLKIGVVFEQDKSMINPPYTMKHIIPIPFLLLALLGFSIPGYGQNDRTGSKSFLPSIEIITSGQDSQNRTHAIYDILNRKSSKPWAYQLERLAAGEEEPGFRDASYSELYAGDSDQYSEESYPSTDTPFDDETIRLEEASPNPARGSTWISYFIPQGTVNAKIVVRNLLGSVVKTEPIDVNANGVRLSTGDLNNGIYIFSLIINNQAIKSKRLVVAN